MTARRDPLLGALQSSPDAWEGLAQRKAFQAGIVRRPGTFAEVLIEQQRKTEAEKAKPQSRGVAA